MRFRKSSALILAAAMAVALPALPGCGPQLGGYDYNAGEARQSFTVYRATATEVREVNINSGASSKQTVGGVIGAICTTLGVVLPSIITLSIVTGFYLEFAANPYIAAALKGIRAGVVALMVSAVINLCRPVPKNWMTWAIFLAAFVLDDNAGGGRMLTEYLEK